MVIKSTTRPLSLSDPPLATVYFLPVWFQSINGVSAMESGIRLLPTMLSIVVGSMSGGFTNNKIGYYTPLAIVGSCIMCIGAGLLTTLQIDTDKGKWIGYQVIYGLGLGWCFQAPNLAVQTVLPLRDVPIGLALMIFTQLLSGAIFVSVGESVLDNQLVQRLSGVPGFTSNLITSGGATTLLSSVPANMRETVLAAYAEALRKVFQLGLILSCLTILGTATLEWRSVLQKPAVNVDAETGGMAPEKKSRAEDGVKSDSEAAVIEPESERAEVAVKRMEKETSFTHMLRK